MPLAAARRLERTDPFSPGVTSFTRTVPATVPSVFHSSLPPASELFEMACTTSYRTDLVGGCPSAARADANSIVQTESQGTQLCENDHIKIYDPTEAKATGTGAFPQCRVGKFTAVSNR